MKMNKIRTIEIDVDGVIFDVWHTFFHNERFRYAAEARQLNFTKDDLNNFEMSALTFDQRALCKMAFMDIEFMTHLDLCQGVADAICLLSKMFEYKHIDCVILNTEVWNDTISPVRKWQLETLFSALSQYNFLVSVFTYGCKRDFGCDALIEDNAGILLTDNRKDKYNMVIDAPYNRENTDLLRFSNLYEAVKYITNVNMEGQ